MTAEIVTHAPGAVITRTRLAETVTRVGAAPDNELCLGQPGVGPYHLRVVRDDGGYFVEPAGAGAAVRVNGTALAARARLGNLDVLTLAADVDLIFLESAAQRDAAPAPAGSAVSRVTLQWMNGPDQGAAVPVARGDLVIGRGEGCGLVINAPALSRTHARLTFDGDTVTIADAGSANGTAVNGGRIAGAVTLKDGDEITFGNLRTVKVLIVRAGGSNAAPAPPVVLPVPEAPASPAVPGTVLDLQWQSKLIWNGPEPGDVAAAPAPAAGDRTRFEAGRGPIAPPVMPARDAGDRTTFDAGGGIVPPVMPDLGSSVAGPVPGVRTTFQPAGGGIAPPVMPGDGGRTRLEPPAPIAPPVAPDFDKARRSESETRMASPEPAKPAPVAPPTPRRLQSEEPTPPPRRTLAITGARLRGAADTFTLRSGRSTVGRAVDADVKLASRTVSRAHAIIEVTATAVIVEDLGKENGTEVNGVRVKGRRPLDNGDKLSFAEESFTVDILRDEHA